MKKYRSLIFVCILAGALCSTVKAQEPVPVAAGSVLENREVRAIRETVSVLDVKSEVIESVLKKIMDQTGLVIIFPEPGGDRVSLFIENVNVWDLLRIILQPHDLAYYRTNGAVHVMRQEVFRQRYGEDFGASAVARIIPVHYAGMEPMVTLVKAGKSPEGRIWADTKNRQIIVVENPEKADELRALVASRDLLLTTREFELQYVSYGTIREGLNRMLTKAVGRAEYSASQRKITVTDTEEITQAVALFLDQQDRRVVVPFRVKIMRVGLSEERSEGIDWEAIVSDYMVSVLRPASQFATVSENIYFGTVTREDYEILIDALDAVGELIHLIAFDFEPAVNKEDALDLDTNDPFWSLRPGVKRAQDGPVILDPNGFAMKINFLLSKSGDEFGLELIPRLHWMDYGGLPEEQERPIFIAPEKIRISFSRDDVIVIGGLLRTEETARLRKFPLLGDLPVVGSVFRRERRRYESIEYIIFLLPENK